MPDDLYGRDVLAWSEREALLLRRLAAGERVNDLIDWPNLIDEVEALGRSEVHACESLLEQALLHLLKAALWPEHPAAGHWRQEAGAFLYSAGRRYAPSMQRHIDLDDLYRRAVPRAQSLAYAFGEARPVRTDAPFYLEELLQAEVIRLIAAIGDATV